MRSLALPLALLAASCGLRPVELAPGAPDVRVEGDVPRAVLERFAEQASGRADEKRLSFRYPSQLARLPRDFPPLTFAWQSDDRAMPGKGASAFFELCLRSVHHALCIYTGELATAAPPEHWAGLVDDSWDEPLSVSLRALLGNELLEAPARELTFSGAIGATRFYVQPETGGHLLGGELASTALEETPFALVVAERDRAASYAVSRDGRGLVYTPSDKELALVSLPSLTPLWQTELPLAGKGPVSLAFDATARRIACARGGTLALLDADTGMVLAMPMLPDGTRVGHPSWSPDDRQLAVTLWPEAAEPDEQALVGSSIASLAVGLDGSLGAPELLVAPTKDDDTLVFPSYSPDGRWLAFERLKGKLRDARDARIWILASGAREPVELGYAEEMAGKAERGTQHLPSWLVSDDTLWLLFASSRTPSGALAKEQRQLWMAPIAGVAGDAKDPSGAALWLPFQAPELSVVRGVVAPHTW